jgi:hypothetical protein
MNEERKKDKMNDLFEKADGPGLSVVHLENPMAAQQGQNFGVEGITWLTHHLHVKATISTSAISAS